MFKPGDVIIKKNGMVFIGGRKTAIIDYIEQSDVFGEKLWLKDIGLWIHPDRVELANSNKEKYILYEDEVL